MFLLVGLGIGSTIGGKQAVTKQDMLIKESEADKKEEKSKTLTTKQVTDFLIAYYTKKDLGENRHRYEPFVTTAMYNELTTVEDQPVNQAYKGYTVNQVLNKSDIYINEEESAAIVSVSYNNTQRVKKGTDEGALLNQSNQEAIKLTFTKQGSHYLVNKLEYVTLTNPMRPAQNTYKEINSDKADSEELPEKNEEIPAQEELPDSSEMQETESLETTEIPNYYTEESTYE